MRINFISKIILLMGILPILAACQINDDCIDADDFGFIKPNISAAGVNKQGTQADEYVDWVYSGLVYDGGPINILIRNGDDSKWCSWFGYGESTITDGMKNVGACQTPNNNWCAHPDDPEQYQTIINAPCYFDQGLGLYGLITDPNYPNSDPNVNEKTSRNPCNIDASTFHLGDVTRQTDSNEETGVVFAQDSDLGYAQKYGRGKFYLKILDNYYTDNSGQYRLVIKSGFEDPNPGPIATIMKSIVCQITGGDDCNNEGGIAGKIFMNIIQNNIFLSIIKSTLILYISFLGVGFALGLIAMNQQQLLTIMFKLVFVVFLIPSSSNGSALTVWNFFNQNLFSLFSSGFSSVLDMVLNVSSNGSVADLGFFDSIYHFFTSKETHAKILSLFFAYIFPVGIFSVCMIYAGLFILLVCVAKAVIFYLMTVIVIGLLISLAPIFIVFLLFKQTKGLFDGWLAQLTSYTIQPLLIFSGIGFMMQLIINKFQKLLGFPVCPQNIIGYGDFSILKFWRAEAVDPTRGNFHYPGNATIDGEFCIPYQCPVSDYYINLPFLDPANDTGLINIFLEGSYQKLFPEFLVFGLLCYLVFRFNDLVPDIAKGITGTSANTANIGSVGSSIMASLGLKDGDLMASTINGMLSAPSKIGNGLTKVRNGIEGVASYATTGKFDTYKNKREEREHKKEKEKAANDKKIAENWSSMSKGEKAAHYAKTAGKGLLNMPGSMLKGAKEAVESGRAYLGDDKEAAEARAQTLDKVSKLKDKTLDKVGKLKDKLEEKFDNTKIGKLNKKYNPISIVRRKINEALKSEPEKYERSMFEEWQDSIGGKADKVERAYNVKSEELSKAAHRSTYGLIGSKESRYTNEDGSQISSVGSAPIPEQAQAAQAQSARRLLPSGPSVSAPPMASPSAAPNPRVAGRSGPTSPESPPQSAASSSSSAGVDPNKNTVKRRNIKPVKQPKNRGNDRS